MISYSNDWKTGLLGVPHEIIEEHGAVSAETAKEMAENVREKSCASIGIASTGIAGPTGGTEEKPIGLVYIAISDETLPMSPNINSLAAASLSSFALPRRLWLFSGGG